ncbi:hypothetical protein EON65_56990, partial [archaeon]
MLFIDKKLRESILYVDKQEGTVCYLVSLSDKQASSLPSYVEYDNFPSAFKIDPNILEYARSRKLPSSHTHYLTLQVHRILPNTPSPSIIKREVDQVLKEIHRDIDWVLRTIPKSLHSNITSSSTPLSLYHELL